MGCGATKQKLPRDSKPAVDGSRDRSVSPSKGLRKSKSAWEDEHHCPSDELGKVFTIQQAFPVIDILGNRHSATKIPEEVNCSQCHRHLLNEGQELEFYVCRRCWSEGHVFTICSACHSATEIRVASEKLTPLSAAKQRRRSSTMTNLSSSTSPKRGQMIMHHRTSTRSSHLQEFQRSNSIRSDTTAVTDEPQDEPGKPMLMPLEQQRRRRSSSPRKRRSSAPETPSKNPNAFNRRKSDGDVAEVSTGLLPEESLPERLSGNWVAKIHEGKKNNRTEMRYLKFGLNGNVFGSCEDGHLSGNLELPKIQWMEEYPWGTMHVTGRLLLKEMKIVGTFQASDGGKGKISLEPNHLE